MALVLNKCRKDRDEVEDMQEWAAGKNYEEGVAREAEQHGVVSTVPS